MTAHDKNQRKFLGNNGQLVACEAERNAET